MTKNQEIRRQILQLVANGVDVIEALKTVCGDAAIEAMIRDIYETLRASK